MEASDIGAALASTRRYGKVICAIFALIALQCLVLAVLHCVSLVAAFVESGPVFAFVQFPGIFGWASFTAAAVICALSARRIGKGSSIFNDQVRRQFLVSAVLLWVYALIDFAWMPILEQAGVLLEGDAFSFKVIQYGLDMGFNFNVGAVFAAGALTLIASLVHYASLLQQQADELW